MKVDFTIKKKTGMGSSKMGTQFTRFPLISHSIAMKFTRFLFQKEEDNEKGNGITHLSGSKI